jgi:hypothetical protein
MPAYSLDPTNLLQDVPPLPDNLRGLRELEGHSVWKIPLPELNDSGQVLGAGDSWDPELTSMKSDPSRGFHWICPGEHEVDEGNIDSKAVGNTEGYSQLLLPSEHNTDLSQVSSSLRDTSPHSTSPRDAPAHDTSSQGTSQCGTNARPRIPTRSCL